MEQQGEKTEQIDWRSPFYSSNSNVSTLYANWVCYVHKITISTEKFKTNTYIEHFFFFFTERKIFLSTQVNGRYIIFIISLSTTPCKHIYSQKYFQYIYSEILFDGGLKNIDTIFGSIDSLLPVSKKLLVFQQI